MEQSRRGGGDFSGMCSSLCLVQKLTRSAGFHFSFSHSAKHQFSPSSPRSLTHSCGPVAEPCIGPVGGCGCQAHGPASSGQVEGPAQPSHSPSCWHLWQCLFNTVCLAPEECKKPWGVTCLNKTGMETQSGMSSRGCNQGYQHSGMRMEMVVLLARHRCGFRLSSHRLPYLNCCHLTENCSGVLCTCLSLCFFFLSKVKGTL